MSSTAQPTRRDFLKNSSQAAAGGVLLGTAPGLVTRPGGLENEIRIAFVGCGGRGTGAAVNALRADPNARIVAMADAFADRLESSLNQLQNPDNGVQAQVDVPAERQFVGFDAYKKAIDAGVDLVILATPPHFRPAHIEAAVAAGKHVFAEKPVAVDGPGLRSVLETCKKAKEKNLAVVSGLCYRYHNGRVATMEQVHQGAIGDIVSIDVRYITNELWSHPRKEGWSDMEWQMRNWLYFTWLSGDLIAEQHIHSLDAAAWAMKDHYPTKAVSLGGRQKRTDPAFGHVYDHFSTIYTYDNGVTVHSYCRQQNGCSRDVSDHFIGTEGRCDFFRHKITGRNPWKFEGKVTNMYQSEHDALFASIRSGAPINNGEYMCHSTLMAIMGRMAAYTGQEVTWEQALNSEAVLGPTSYAWGDLAVADVAIPGITKMG